jgi:hypothetical protein
MGGVFLLDPLKFSIVGGTKVYSRGDRFVSLHLRGFLKKTEVRASHFRTNGANVAWNVPLPIDAMRSTINAALTISFASTMKTFTTRKTLSNVIHIGCLGSLCAVSSTHLLAREKGHKRLPHIIFGHTGVTNWARFLHFENSCNVHLERLDCIIY